MASYHLRPVHISPSPDPDYKPQIPRRPLSPSSLRDVDLSQAPDAAHRKYPTPPTGHDLMAMFPPAPPDSFPEMRPGPTSGFFQRQERAFFAQAGKEIVRVRVEVDFPGEASPMNEQKASSSRGGGVDRAGGGGGRQWLSGPPPPHAHSHSHSQSQHHPPQQQHPHPLTIPHPHLPPHPHVQLQQQQQPPPPGHHPAHSPLQSTTSSPSMIYPHPASRGGAARAPGPPSSYQGASGHGSPPPPGGSGGTPPQEGTMVLKGEYGIGGISLPPPPSSAVSAGGGGGGAGGPGGVGEDYNDDEAWRRPMPYHERRRAGKHTKRIIVRT